jgi:DNA repair exonuclease SbcCD nuclease subunit
MKILHCADLHISRKEQEYSLAVLGEIVRIAQEESCSGILICGDLFDSWEDLQILRKEIRKKLEGLAPNCRVILVPGNHEMLRSPKDGGSLDTLDLEPIELCTQTPFSLIPLSDQIEILAIPFSREMIDFQNWSIPLKKAKYRLLAAHGTVPGLIYAGPEEEEGEGGVLDPELIRKAEADYAALGHIHGALESRAGTVPIVYPGSARVWREGEEGLRSIVLIEAGEKLFYKKRIVQGAGIFRRVEVDVTLEGVWETVQFLDQLRKDLGKADWIQLELVGIVEDEKKVMERAGAVSKELEEFCRKVTIDRTRLEGIEGLSGHPLAQKFLAKWKEQYREAGKEEQEILRYARIQGLRTINELKRGKK